MDTKVFFFFSHAEDGIRDGHVTGVQTCALPISTHLAFGLTAKRKVILLDTYYYSPQGKANKKAPSQLSEEYFERSEELRVGKECRFRWEREKYKKKKAYRFNTSSMMRVNDNFEQ